METTTRGENGEVAAGPPRYGENHARTAPWKDDDGRRSSSSAPGPRDHGTGTTGGREETTTGPRETTTGAEQAAWTVKPSLNADYTQV